MNGDGLLFWQLQQQQQTAGGACNNSVTKSCFVCCKLSLNLLNLLAIKWGESGRRGGGGLLHVGRQPLWFASLQRVDSAVDGLAVVLFAVFLLRAFCGSRLKFEFISKETGFRVSRLRESTFTPENIIHWLCESSNASLFYINIFYANFACMSYDPETPIPYQKSIRTQMQLCFGFFFTYHVPLVRVV